MTMARVALLFCGVLLLAAPLSDLPPLVTSLLICATLVLAVVVVRDSRAGRQR